MEAVKTITNAQTLAPAADQAVQKKEGEQSLTPLFYQPKLTIGSPDDPLEKEADDMADKVMRMEMPQPISFSSAKNSLNRKCAHCEEEEKQLQRKESSGGSVSEAPSLVHDVINSSGGRSIDTDTRSFMESRFNYDFSSVKIHDDDVAAKSASSINALAYTSGNNIVFNSGQYNTTSDSGKKLLAHELTHVVQQGKSCENIFSKSQKMIQRQNEDLSSMPEEENFEEGIDLGIGQRITPLRGQTIQRYLVGPPRMVGATAAAGAPAWGHCREFNYVINWNTDIRDGYILQECINADTITKCDGTNVVPPNTPHYWEAWYVDPTGAISDGNADTWYRAPKPGTRGRWTFDSNVFTAGSLDPAWGFRRGAVGTAGGLLATVTGPSHNELYQPSLVRHFGGQWDCCDGKDTHTPI